MRGREGREKENGRKKTGQGRTNYPVAEKREIAAASQWIPEALPQIRTKGEKGERGGKIRIERRERRKRRKNKNRKKRKEKEEGKKKKIQK